MQILKSSDYKLYSKFIENLAYKLTRFYYSKLNKPFKVSNKLRSGYDPVTTADRAFERFIRNEIKKKFPNHQIIGEEFGSKKTKSDYSWIIDPIDGTRSFVIGNPTWSNLISLNYKGTPIIGLANFPILRKFYFNTSSNISYVSENGKKKRILVNQKASYSHLAEGKLDVVIQCGNKIWDIHALIPIIEAAKGVVSTWKNDNAKKAGNIICSANNGLHKKMLKILKPVSS